MLVSTLIERRLYQTFIYNIYITHIKQLVSQSACPKKFQAGQPRHTKSRWFLNHHF